jgi:hypothetical protein
LEGKARLSEHYTKATTETLNWCSHCGRHTKHSVSGGRLGRCMEHEFIGYKNSGLTKQQYQKRERDARDRREPKLF